MKYHDEKVTGTEDGKCKCTQSRKVRVMDYDENTGTCQVCYRKVDLTAARANAEKARQSTLAESYSAMIMAK